MSEIVERIWSRDPTLWTGADEAQWLGWLDEPWRMREDIDLLLQFADALVGEIDAVVLLGMGGSSLAPEVFKQTFGAETFHVLDTTHPRAIRALEAQLDLERTLFVSASKSGSTLETRSHTDYFWERSSARATVGLRSPIQAPHSKSSRGSATSAPSFPGSRRSGAATRRCRRSASCPPR